MINTEREVMIMYRFNVYENFTNGEFKFLTIYSCSASNRDEATYKAQIWANNTYPTRNVDVMCVN